MGRRPCWGWQMALQEAGSWAGGPLGTSEVTPPPGKGLCAHPAVQMQERPRGAGRAAVIGEQEPRGPF